MEPTKGAAQLDCTQLEGYKLSTLFGASHNHQVPSRPLHSCCVCRVCLNDLNCPNGICNSFPIRFVTSSELQCRCHVFVQVLLSGLCGTWGDKIAATSDCVNHMQQDASCSCSCCSHVAAASTLACAARTDKFFDLS